MTVQAVVDLMEGYSRLVDRQPKNFYRQIWMSVIPVNLIHAQLSGQEHLTDDADETERVCVYITCVIEMSDS